MSKIYMLYTHIMRYVIKNVLLSVLFYTRFMLRVIKSCSSYHYEELRWMWMAGYVFVYVYVQISFAFVSFNGPNILCPEQFRFYFTYLFL